MALNMNAAVKVRASVDGLQQIEGLRKGLGGVESQAGRTGGALGRLRSAGGAAMNALRVIAPAASVAGLAAMAKKTLDSADALSKMSERTGVAVPMLDKFRQAAEYSDTTLDAVGKGLNRLARPTADATSALGEMGISLTDASGKLRGTDEVMLDVANRFKDMENGAEKSALAQRIFGKALGDELIPMLNMGGDAIKKLETSFTDAFAKRAAAFNDEIKAMQERFGMLAAELTIALLPALEVLVGVIAKAMDAFLSLPKEIQAVIGVVGLLAGAFALFAPVITPLVGIFKALAAIKLAPVFASIAGSLGAVIPVLGTVAKVLLAVFTGPVGWVALAVAAGVAIFAFRDQIGQAFQAIGQMLVQASTAFKTTFVDPIINWNKFLFQQFTQIFQQIAQAIQSAFQQAIGFVNNTFIQPATQAVQNFYQGILQTFSNLASALKAPFDAVGQMIRGVLNGILGGIENAINGAIGGINALIRAANRALSAVGAPTIPQVSPISIPRFADGGMVSGPTLAMVGEGGEPEYIVPQSKAAGFAENWLAGRRGLSAIPRFAEGGVVMPSSAQVSIQTGPVTQMDGTQYVTTQDLGRAVQAGVQQTLTLLRNDINTRRAVGIA